MTPEDKKTRGKFKVFVCYDKEDHKKAFTGFKNTLIVKRTKIKNYGMKRHTKGNNKTII